jgi:hypothetical protein
LEKVGGAHFAGSSSGPILELACATGGALALDTSVLLKCALTAWLALPRLLVTATRVDFPSFAEVVARQAGSLSSFGMVLALSTGVAIVFAGASLELARVAIRALVGASGVFDLPHVARPAGARITIAARGLLVADFAVEVTRVARRLARLLLVLLVG